MADVKMAGDARPRKTTFIICADCGAETPSRSHAKRRCEPCSKEWTKARNRASAKAWGLANPERVSSEARRQRRMNNLDAERARDRERYQRIKGKRAEYNKEYYRKNREQILARLSSPEGKQAAAERMRKRLHTDPQFRLHTNISRAIRAAIKGKGGRGWENLVGYTTEELVAHIERQFMRGMGWHNYGQGAGKWNIDHIIPQASFTFSDPSEPDFRACWAITNLRPLWSEQNISKHAKITHLL